MPYKTGAFPRSERLRGRQTFALFAKASHAGTNRIKVAAVYGEGRKAAFVVGKKISPLAIHRNRVKRRLREIYRKHRTLLPENIWLMIIAKPEALNAEFSSLETDFQKICRLLKTKFSGNSGN